MYISCLKPTVFYTFVAFLYYYLALTVMKAERSEDVMEAERSKDAKPGRGPLQPTKILADKIFVEKIFSTNPKFRHIFRLNTIFVFRTAVSGPNA